MTDPIALGVTLSARCCVATRSGTLRSSRSQACHCPTFVHVEDVTSCPPRFRPVCGRLRNNCMFFVLVHVPAHVGHVSKQCVVRLDLGAEDIAHRVILEFSCDESRSDSVSPNFAMQVCRTFLFDTRGLVTLSSRHFSDICVNFEAFCGVLIVSSSCRVSSHCHTLNVPLRAFASRMILLRRHVQCGFSCLLGRRRRPDRLLLLVLTSGNGLSLSVLRNSTRSLC